MCLTYPTRHTLQEICTIAVFLFYFNLFLRRVQKTPLYVAICVYKWCLHRYCDTIETRHNKYIIFCKDYSSGR